MHTNKDLKLIINLHRSPLLADAVGALLKSAGYSDGEEIALKAFKAYGHTQKGCGIRVNKELGYGSMRFYLSENESSAYTARHTFIDAATEMGKLVALLEKPEPKRIKRVTEEYDGLIADDKSGITVGCSFVPREKVREAYEALFS